MGKQPAFQFYPNDYMRDTRCLSLAAKGAWADLLCAMWWSQTRGQLSMPLIGYTRLLGATVDQTEAVIKEIIEMRVCDHETESNGNLTLINRRMVREEKERESTRLRVQRHRNTAEKREGNVNVTPPSSTSSSTSKKKKENTAPQNGAAFSLFWKLYPKKTKPKLAHKEWDKAKEKPAINELVKILQQQIENKAQLKKAGVFCPEWPDPERWIKHARWLDELVWPTQDKPMQPPPGPPARIRQGDDILENRNGQWVKIEEAQGDV